MVKVSFREKFGGKKIKLEFVLYMLEKIKLDIWKWEKISPKKSFVKQFVNKS